MENLRFALNVVIISFFLSIMQSAHADIYNCDQPPGSSNLNGMLHSLYRDDLTTSPEVAFRCERRAQFHDNGKQYRLFATQSLLESPVAAVLSFMESAFRNSVREYNRADTRYRLPSIDMIVVERPYRAIREARLSFIPGASTTPTGSQHYRGRDDVCPIIIFFGNLRTDTDGVENLIAHEVFHCMQARNFGSNLLPQHFNDSYRRANNWWIEGTAEYFATTVNPTNTYANSWLTRLAQNSVNHPFFDMAYEAWPLFQYLAANSSRTTVFDLLREVSRANTEYEQLRQLTHLPNFPEIFQNYTQAALDITIPSLNGTALGINRYSREPVDEYRPRSGWTGPEHSTVINRSTPMPIRLSIQSLQAGRHILIFPAGKRYNISLSSTRGQGRSAAKKLPRGYSSSRDFADPLLSREAWTALPASICAAEQEQYLLAQTTAGHDDFELSINVSISDEQCCNSGANGDINSCVVGNWRLTDEATQAFFGGKNTPHVDGSVTVQISKDGSYTKTYAGVTVESEKYRSVFRGEERGCLTMFDVQSEMNIPTGVSPENTMQGIEHMIREGHLPDGQVLDGQALDSMKKLLQSMQNPQDAGSDAMRKMSDPAYDQLYPTFRIKVSKDEVKEERTNKSTNHKKIKTVSANRVSWFNRHSETINFECRGDVMANGNERWHRLSR